MNFLHNRINSRIQYVKPRINTLENMQIAPPETQLAK